MEFFHSPWSHVLLLSLYYCAIIVGLVLLYGKGQFTAIKFVYQGF
jgi:hypothetical protein